MAIQKANIALDNVSGDQTLVAAPAAGNKIIVLGFLIMAPATLPAGGFSLKSSGGTNLMGSAAAPIGQFAGFHFPMWAEGGIPLIDVPAGEGLVYNSTAAGDVAIWVFYDTVKA